MQLFEKVIQGLRVRGSWRPNITEIFWPSLLWPSRLCLSSYPDAGVLSAGCWLSLLHLISIFSGPQLIRAPSPFGLVWLSLPHLVWNCLGLNSTGYCSIRRPYITFKLPCRGMDKPPRLRNFFRYLAIGMYPFRYLWKGLCDRHRADITVMQFTGHSLPVHQSMSVPSEIFSSSHFISQFLPTRFPLITAIGMCHFLPVHHHGMAFLAGSKGQITTQTCIAYTHALLIFPC